MGFPRSQKWSGFLGCSHRGLCVRAIEPASTASTFVVWLGAASAAERKWFSTARLLQFHSSRTQINGM